MYTGANTNQPSPSGMLATIGGLSLLVVSWQLRRRDTSLVRIAAA